MRMARMEGMEVMEGMEIIHDSPAMQRLHAQMLRAQCQTMHGQMEQMLGGRARMGDGMDAHHPRVA